MSTTQKRYIHGSWSHIFDAKEPDRPCLIAFDTQQQKLVSLQVMRSGHMVQGNRLELSDVEDSLLTANYGVLENPEAEGLDQSDVLPGWAATDLAKGRAALDASACALAESVKKWWEAHRYDTTGPRGDRNVFDSEPEFVTKAKSIIGDWNAE